MTRTGQAAIDYARSRVGKNAMPASGYCLQFVRECFAVGSYYASAIAAWNASPTKHPGDRNPPPAVPLYFVTPSQYDHVVFGGDVGEIITTFNADVRRYTSSTTSGAIDQIVRDFGPGSYLGWTEDINRVRIWTPAQEAPDMTPDEAQRLMNIEAAVGRLDAMWSADDGRNRVHDFDLTTDWSSQTTSAVGRVETNQDELIGGLTEVAKEREQDRDPQIGYGGTRHRISDADVNRIAIAVAHIIDQSN